MSILEVKDLRLSFSGPPLFDGANFNIEERERVCLMGRNGCGKTTLLKILAGTASADSVEIIKSPHAHIAYLPQEVPTDLAGSIFAAVAAGLRPGLESYEGEVLVHTAISRVELDPSDLCENLSGGQKRRVLLARALVSQPDLLLLDEPTNHLDIPSINWLENFVKRLDCAVLFVSHDRAFVRNMATRILELDRGQISSWDASYDRYLELREARLEAEDRHCALFDKKLAAEEVWIRQGIKARRTRNEGRVRALKKMRAERSQRRERQGQVKMRIESADPSGKLVLAVQDLSFSWPAKSIVQGLDLVIARGDRLGIVGPNGSGKTTLLNLLLGKLEPQEGEVRLGTNLQIAYFDQLRQELRPEQTLLENIGDGKEFIEINGKNRHVLSYLSDFLFSADRARGPISALSGGERNRLLLARIFSQASNVLVLDEPTNDLDMETLDLLEDLLAEYAGTVIAVSHDREFLDRVVSSCLIMQNEGVVREFVGGYSDWEAQQKNEQKIAPKSKADLPPANPSELQTESATAAAPRKKLSYREQRELDELPARIEKLEASVESLQKQLSDPAIYSNHLAVQKLQDELQQSEAELLTAYERWEELS